MFEIGLKIHSASIGAAMKILAPMKYVTRAFLISLLVFLLVMFTFESGSIFITISLLSLAFFSSVVLIGFFLILITSIPGVLCSPFVYIHLRRWIVRSREEELEAQENHERLLKKLRRLEKMSEEEPRT